MAGNVKFDSCSVSPEELVYVGNYTNGQRGSYTGVGLGRSGSFCEGGESRVFASTMSSQGSATSSGDLPPLSEWLTLDPITLGDRKCTRLGELRRTLGIPFGSSLEDCNFGAAHSKPLPPAAIEELKQFKATVRDASIKARGRAKKFDDSLQKLTKYSEALNSKKQRRSDTLTNETLGGPNFLKTGTQIHRHLLAQRKENKSKNVVLNKRVRSSVAEIKAEGRNNSFVRQPLLIGKERDMLKDVGECSETVEEKIRRLPVAGEMWDRKMKKKRSVGTVSMRPIDDDAEPKQGMHPKYKNETALQSSDVQCFRSGSFNGSSVANKDGTCLPVGSNSRMIPKNELDRVPLLRDLTSSLSRERIIAKGNNMLLTCEDDSIVSPNSVTNVKDPRALRSSPLVPVSSSPNLPCTSGAPEVCELPPSLNKLHSASGVNNRKRPLPPGSSSSPMAQWVGQRPQKISRTRRTNLVSPVSGHDELQTSSEACLPSDLVARVTSVGTNGSVLARNGTKHFRVKHENVSSPARLSESEESGAGESLESRSKDKQSRGSEVDKRAVNSFQNVLPSLLFAEKNKVLNKGDPGDGVRRQGRSGRGSSVSGATISPMREKLENLATTKPPRSTRPASEKIGSRSGRPPLKKLSERKAFTRPGQASIGSSPGLAGESDDDHEELLAAANFACNWSYLACSSSFWKKIELIFASASLVDASYLKQQLKSTGENCESLFQMVGDGNNIRGEPMPGKNCFSQAFDSGEKERIMEEQTVSNGMCKTGDLDDQDLDIGTLEITNLESMKNITPFYRRVLSALIVEDETEEFEENNGERDMSFQYSRDDSPDDTCLPLDVDSTIRVRSESNSESILGLQTLKHSCNGRTVFTRPTIIHNKLSSDDLFQGNHGCMHPNTGMFPSFSRYFFDGPLAEYSDASGVLSIGYPYDQMCLQDKLFLELHSIAIYPETVPDLADREDESIDKDIYELQKELHRQVGKRKVHMTKIIEAIEEARKTEERDLEHIAMDRLVELAYKKKLATRASIASKCGVTRVSKQVALAFAKWTLSRCRKFEDTGESCFAKPALRDVIFAAPSNGKTTESRNCVEPAVAISLPCETENSQTEPRISGPFPSRTDQFDCSDKTGSSSVDVFRNLSHQSDQDFAKTGPICNRGKKKEVLLDDVGGSASSRAVSTLGNTQVAGAKGKRSERERDKDTSGRNSVPKASRALLVNVKGERKAKTKPKQKTAQLLSSVNGFANKFTEATHAEYHSPRGSSEVVANGSNVKEDKALLSHVDIPQDRSKERKEPLDITNLPLHELDPIELGDANDFGGPQDLSTWLNIDDDNLQDHDLAGLDIPMDDLSELNMIL